MAKVEDVARFFIDYGEKSEEPMTNMRINKMLYFAQGIHLAKGGNPLFEDDIEAWPWGPVVSDIYHQYKSFESKPIIDPKSGFFRDNFTESEYATLLDTARIYGVYTTPFLVTKSHRSGGPWDSTMKTTEKVIPKDLIRKEFSGNSLIFAIPADALQSIDTRGEDGTFLLPKEDDDGDEWSEYDAI